MRHPGDKADLVIQVFKIIMKNKVVAILFFLSLLSCSTLNKKRDFNFRDKAKLRITLIHDSEKIVAKGFISIIGDSELIYFNFFGPLGVPVIKGSYINTFQYFNYLTNIRNDDVETKIYLKYGIRFNRNCLKFFLKGSLDSLFRELTNVNIKNINLKFDKHNYGLSIINLELNKSIDIKYRYNNSFPTSILIEAKQEKRIQLSVLLEYM